MGFENDSVKLFALKIFSPQQAPENLAVDDDGQLRSRWDHEDEGRIFLQTLDKEASQVCNNEVVAEWRYASDITDQNERLKVRLLCNSSVSRLISDCLVGRKHSRCQIPQRGLEKRHQFQLDTISR